MIPNKNAVYHLFLDICSNWNNSRMNVPPIAVNNAYSANQYVSGEKK